MLTVYKSNRQEKLVEALAELVATPVAGPMEPEWIGVQSQGMKTWLEMQISEKLGVWANFKLLFPRNLIEQIFAWVLGKKFVKSRQFEGDHLAWSVMQLLPKYLDTDAFRPIRHYLANDDAGLKRFQLSAQIAKVFDEYLVYRPDMILEWEGTGGDDWQGILWNGLKKQHGTGHFASQARLFFDTLAVKSGEDFPFPKRLSLFGIVTLPPLFIKILGSLPDAVEVNLFSISHSEQYWADIRSKREIIRALPTENAPLDELENLHHGSEGNPLLLALGRLERDFLYLMEDETHYTEQTANLYQDPGEHTVITALQSDILQLKNRSLEKDPFVITPGDQSLSIHACHSPMREVEVLKDRLLSLFDQDDSLKPHDIVVMAPDIETYAPYIDAVFGTTSPALPYRISDRSFRHEAPVIEAFLAIIDMVQGRVTIQEVLDLLEMEVVRETFALTEDDVEIAASWTVQVGIRWGMDAAHKQRLGQPGYEENTWQFGLDRLLLGYAMPLNDRILFGGVLPYDEIEGPEALVLGRYVAFVQALFRELQFLSKSRHPGEWKTALTQTLHHLVNQSLENSDQHKRILDTLHQLEEVAGSAGFSEPLPLQVIRRFLVNHLEKDPSARGFLRHGITCCSLLPMRSIPFKVVCLIGMNEGAFPRAYKGPGFDKMVGAPRLGDRSLRSDDRYLFLESLSAARQSLLITYIGHSVVDGSTLPPSVLVDELLDTIQRGFCLEMPPASQPDNKVVERLVVSHPLHPFSPAYFGAGNDPRLFSYAGHYLESARALNEQQSESVQLFATPLPLIKEETQLVSLTDLVSFYQMPCRYLAKKRLGLHLLEESEILDTRDPVQLDPLREFTIGSTMLEDRLAGKSIGDTFSILKAMGVLPLGSVGRYGYETLAERVAGLAERISKKTSDAGMEPIDVELELEGTKLVGRLENMWQDDRIQHRYATVKPKNRLELWIYHLALNCLPDTDYPKTSIWFGRKGSKTPSATAFFPIEGDPREILANLIRLYRLGQTEPLRFFPERSFEFAKDSLDPKLEEDEATAAAIRKALNAWHDTNSLSEADDPAVVLAFGDLNPLSTTGSDPENDFQHLALSVFSPLIHHTSKVKS